MGQMPDVLILGVVCFTVDLQRNVVCFRILDFFFSRFDAPLSPRSDDGHFGSKRLNGQLETDLIVALAGAAVADGVCALGLGNFNDTLCDDRAGKGRAEQVLVLVDRTCLYGGINIFLNEFFLEVFNVELRCTGLQCFFFQTVKLRALTHVGGNRDDLAVVVVFLQPRDDDGGIQTTGVRQNDLFNILLCLCHDVTLPFFINRRHRAAENYLFQRSLLYTVFRKNQPFS